MLGPSTRELIERGYLTPYRAFVADPPDLSGIKKNAEGDYRETDLAAVMNTSQLRSISKLEYVRLNFNTQLPVPFPPF